MEKKLSEKKYNGGCITAIELLKDCKGLRILDVGIGNGEVGKSLYEEAIVDGVTLSRFESADASGFYRNIYIGDFLNLKLDKLYDFVVFSHVLEHCGYPDNFIVKATSLLNTNGRIIVSVPNILFYKFRYQLLFGNWYYEDEGIWDNTHVKYFTESYFNKLSRSCPFVVASMHHRYVFFSNRLNTIRLKGVFKILKFFGSLFIYEFNWVIRKEDFVSEGK